MQSLSIKSSIMDILIVGHFPMYACYLSSIMAVEIVCMSVTYTWIACSAYKIWSKIGVSLYRYHGEPFIFSPSHIIDHVFAYQEKRQQLLTEIRTLCEAPCYEGLVEFHGAFYTPDSGQISIALEYMDGGSLADMLRVRKKIPEPVLSHMFQKLLHVIKLCCFG